MQKINFSDIDPYVRFSKTLILPPDFSTTDVHACDIRLVYVCQGTVKVKLDSHTYNAGRGSLFLYPSSTKYSIVNATGADAKIMSVNFDYIANPEYPLSPIPTVSDSLWHEANAVENLCFLDTPQFNEAIHLENMHSLEPIFSELTTEYLDCKPYNMQIRGLLMHEVLFLILRQLSYGNRQKKQSLAEKVIDYIQENFSIDLSNEEIGKHFNYHPNYINRVIQKHTGLSLHQYVLSCRVSKALEMLQTSGLSVTEVAEKVGFSSIKHFSQTFKSIYGYSPIHFKD
ncbi:MAG: helix-turn-helix domain-containing protein [Clostridia bacterium]|nr:helix-turn-helix domain-containing protein [Clostridia bacterium]